MTSVCIQQYKRKWCAHVKLHKNCTNIVWFSLSVCLCSCLCVIFLPESLPVFPCACFCLPVSALPLFGFL
uniref:Uncharacterized protein n=1 Tax=Anguilla anguilla TaxID=7936 RepID=A0A0E9U0P5_ANGAN